VCLITADIYWHSKKYSTHTVHCLLTPGSTKNSHFDTATGIMRDLVNNYSLTSLSRPSISRQTRFSPTVAVERIFQHSIYLIKSPPSHLALAKSWNDNDPCKLHLISRHFTTVRLAEWSVPVKVGVRMSLTAGCSGPRHLFPIPFHCVVSVSATLSLIMSLPFPMTRLQSHLMQLWLISRVAVLIRQDYSSVSLSEWC